MQIHGLLIASLLALPLTIPSALAQDCQGAENIVDTAVNAGSFTTLVTALQAAGLDDVLADPNNGRFTVFAPTDAAFAALPAGTVQTLLDPANVGLLTDILLYHVAAGPAFEADVRPLTTVQTLNGQAVDVSVDMQNMLFLDQALVQTSDILCCNGVIHVIDEVLLPATDNLLDTALASPDLGTLTTVAGLLPNVVNVLTDTQNDYTVFAPVDSAFAAVPPARLNALLNNTPLLESIVTYHVVPGRVYAQDVVAANQLISVTGQAIDVSVVGSSVFVDGAEILATDIDATNGVVHLVGSVLLP